MVKISIEEINRRYRGKPGCVVWVCPGCKQDYWYNPRESNVDRSASYCGECAPSPPTFEMEPIHSRSADPERMTKVVVICGSSKYVEEMAVCAWLIERDENAIVMGLHLLPFWYSSEPIPDHLAEHEGVSDRMDELHLRKIDLADEVYIVNVDDYIGDSTRAELKYAQERGKVIRWYTHDEIGLSVEAIKRERIKDYKGVE